MTHIVADTLYILYFMEGVTAWLGWAWEPREVTPGRRPVMDIAGITSGSSAGSRPTASRSRTRCPSSPPGTRSGRGHAPGERASYALACQAAHQTRPPKRSELLSLTELRERWRASTIRGFGACTVYRLGERPRRCGRRRGRWSTSSWPPWTPSPWCT